MKDNAVYDVIGKTYDLTRKADPAIVNTLTQLVGMRPQGHYLDVGCGSGNYTGAIAQKGFKIEGIDLSEEMLNKARKKYPTVQFHHGDATKLPFIDSAFDGVVCTLATHHIRNDVKFFQEAFRLIKSGRLVLFTTTQEQMRNYWLCHYFPNMMVSSLEKMSTFNVLKKTLECAGFGDVQQVPFHITNDLQDFFLHSGKYRPEIYLDPKVRHGISSFHLYANPDEIEKGLGLLKKDIESGEIKKLIARYENSLGDYLFVTGEK